MTRLLLTRPAAQGRQMARQLADMKGLHICHLPVLDIVPRPLPKAFDVAACQHLIMASDNAARLLLRQLQPQQLQGPQLYALSPITARRLRRRSLVVHTPDGGFDSEAMLAHPGLQQVRGQRLAICAGVGGRTLMARRLRQRGGIVQRLSLYGRVPCDIAAALRQLEDGGRRPDVLTAYSPHSLRALARSMERAGLGHWRRISLLALGRRGQNLARRLGFADVRPLQPGTAALRRAIAEWRASAGDYGL